MNRKGFGLIEIIIAIAVVALLAGGGFYIKNLQSQQSAVQTGLDAEKKAQQVMQQVNQQSQQEQNLLNQTSGVTPSSSSLDGYGIVKSVSYDYDNDGYPYTVTLYKSREAAGMGGVGQDLFGIRVILTKGGKVIYKFAPADPLSSYDFYSNDTLLLQDVTNDNIPEITFTSGFEGASDYSSALHILKYQSQTNSINDIAINDFGNSGLSKVHFIRIGSSTLILKVSGEWEGDEGHYGPHFYAYSLYKWNVNQNKFVVIESSKSSQKLDALETAIKDWLSQHPGSKIAF